MSLIIRGVNLPGKCENCPCYDYIDYVYCQLSPVNVTGNQFSCTIHAEVEE